MRKTAFVFRCVKLIADAVRRAPFQIMPINGDAPFDQSDDYQNKLGFLSNPKRINELVTRSLLGPGSAYLFKARQGATLGALKYVVASSIKPKIDGDVGLVGFTRKANGKAVNWGNAKLDAITDKLDLLERKMNDA